MSEQENRDPFACPECGTVNVWSATVCRDCGKTISKESALQKQAAAIEELSAEAPDESPNSDDTEADRRRAPEPHTENPGDSSSLKRRWNIFWIVLGIAIHVAGVHLGVFSIIKFLVEPDTELKETIEKTLAAAKAGDESQVSILDSLDEPLKAKISTIRWALIFLLAIVPVLIGMSAGFFTGTVLDGAAAMGLSAVLIPLLNGAAEFAIFWGPANAALGALGAYLGIRIASRFRRAGPPTLS